jgi:hypothetical protein
MGSGDSNRRKKRRHLPKVGTPKEVERAQHAKQREVLQDVGIRANASGRRALTWILVAVGLARSSASSCCSRFADISLADAGIAGAQLDR